MPGSCRQSGSAKPRGHGNRGGRHLPRWSRFCRRLLRSGSDRRLVRDVLQRSLSGRRTVGLLSELAACQRGRRAAGQEVFGLLAFDHGPAGRQELHDQADLLLRTCHVAPRKPDTVRVAQIGLAVMLAELFGREDELLIGPGVAGIAAGFIERVNYQRAFHLDRCLALLPVEHQTSAETSPGTAIRRIEHGVGPHRHQAVGLFRFVLGRERPWSRPVQIQRCAAGGQRQDRRRQPKARKSHRR